MNKSTARLTPDLTDESGTLSLALCKADEAFIVAQLSGGLNLEIEILQAKKKLLPDGRVQYIIQIPADKGGMVREFYLKLISQSHLANLN